MIKQHQRIILTVFVAILALSLAAAKSSVESISFGENTDVSLGRSGLVFTYSQYDGLVRLSQYQKNLPGTNKPKFTQKLLYTRLYTNDGSKVNFVIGPVYVYFKIRGEEQRLWNKGELTIYYYDGVSNQWKACPTTYIFKPGNSRVSCRVRTMGLFGVGIK